MPGLTLSLLLLLSTLCNADTTITATSDSIAVSVQQVIDSPDKPDRQRAQAIERIAGRLTTIEAALERDWWERYAVLLGMVATLSAVGVAHALQWRSRKRSATAILETLLSEAIDDLRRLCRITELFSIGTRSKASIPCAARRHMMNQLASLTNRSAPLSHLTRAYSDFDRITAYQDQAVDSDARGDDKQADYAQGVAVSFIRSCISGILVNLDAASEAVDRRVRVLEADRNRVELITQMRDDVPGYCVVGTVCVKARDGEATVREVMRHLKWMQSVRLLPGGRAATFIRHVSGRYVAVKNRQLKVLPDVASATRGATWNDPT